MLKARLLPFLAVIGGAGGFFLRRWELASAFESSGLAIPRAPASVSLIVLSIVMALLFFFLCGSGKQSLSSYSDAFSAPGNWVYLLISALASAHLLVAGISFLLTAETRSGTPHILRLLLGAACVLSFFCILNICLGNFRASPRKYSLILLIPGYTFCLWLVSAYQQHAAEPVTLVYIYELLAVICSLFALYFAAAFSFAKASVRWCSVFSLLSIYFCIVTLADHHDRGSLLLLLFSVLYQFSTSLVLLKNAFSGSADPSTELNNTQEVSHNE